MIKVGNLLLHSTVESMTKNNTTEKEVHADGSIGRL